MLDMRNVVARIRNIKGGRRKLASPAWSPHWKGLSVRRINQVLLGMPRQTRYLEIGIHDGYTFEAIKARHKIGVDPIARFDPLRLPAKTTVFIGESDLFFSQYEGSSFSLIFIDGLHEAKQCWRDLLNSLNNLEVGGVILLDDVMPRDEASSLPDFDHSEREKALSGIVHGEWSGDVYKVLGAVATFHPELGIELVGTPDDKVQAFIWRKTEQHKPYLVSEEVMRQIDAWVFADFFPATGLSPVVSAFSESVSIQRVASASRF